MTSTGPIEVTAFKAANSRAYLKAVFDAWAEGQTVMALPEGASVHKVPGTAVQERVSFDADTGWFHEPLPECPPEDRALIAFSSGTTGRPKAILIHHRALQDVVTRINSAMGVDDTIREYLGVPVTYSFGFGRARAVATAGGAVFLPENGFDPGEINRMLGAGEINAVSAVPTLWRVLLVNKSSISANSAQNLRWIEIGSQWMSAEEKLALRHLFPNAKIVQHYGLTEASRTTLLDISEAPEDRLGSVGQAVGATEIAIDDEGRIKTRGPHVAEGLISGAGVKPVTDAEGWLTTSDKGRLEEGWLYYEGRIDELINAGGLKIDPTAFEQAVNTALGVPGAVAAGRLVDDLRGEKVLVALRQDAGLGRDKVTKAAGNVAAGLGLTGAGAFELREVAKIPVTKTGKVKRADLADLPDLGASAAPSPVEPPVAAGSKTADLKALWGEILGIEDVAIDKSFYDLGGDSLSALTAITKMESLGIEADTARGIFAGKPIAEMAGDDIRSPMVPALQPMAKPTPVKLVSGPTLSLADTVNAIHAARGVLVLWVVVVHWLPALLTRLGENTFWVYDALIPMLHFGTPGFAMVFGMGIGALGIHHYESNAALFTKTMLFNTRLIVGGVLLLALAKLLIALVDDTLDDRLVMSGLFYSALTYYALAMLMMPLLIPLLLLGSNRVLTILAVGVGAIVLHELLAKLFLYRQPSYAILEFFKIITTAKFGFFRMTGFVMMGVAIGWLFRRHHQDPDVLRQMTIAALILLGLGGVGIIHASTDTPVADFTQVFLWHLCLYAGTAILILALFARINRAGGTQMRPINWLNTFAMTSGILALPIYVGHEVTWSLKQLSDALGIADVIGLLGVLVLFFGSLTIAYRRIMKFF